MSRRRKRIRSRRYGGPSVPCCKQVTKSLSAENDLALVTITVIFPLWLRWQAAQVLVVVGHTRGLAPSAANTSVPVAKDCGLAVCDMKTFFEESLSSVVRRHSVWMSGRMLKVPML